MSSSIPPHRDAEHDSHNQAVRFSSVTQEIPPSEQNNSIHLVNIFTGKDQAAKLSDEQKKELRDISISLQQSRIQSSRLDQFVFDPVSLPPSRVRLCSDPQHPSRFLTCLLGPFWRILEPCPHYISIIAPKFSHVSWGLPDPANPRRLGFKG
jgi:hypothetical protein